AVGEQEVDPARMQTGDAVPAGRDSGAWRGLTAVLPDVEPCRRIGGIVVAHRVQGPRTPGGVSPRLAAVTAVVGQGLLAHPERVAGAIGDIGDPGIAVFAEHVPRACAHVFPGVEAEALELIRDEKVGGAVRGDLPGGLVRTVVYGPWGNRRIVVIGRTQV